MYAGHFKASWRSQHEQYISLEEGGSLWWLAKEPGQVFTFKALFLPVDLDAHSDAEESFARDLPDFPSINPEVTGIDEEDDTSIGIPSQGHEDLQPSHNQAQAAAELLLGALPSPPNLTNNLAGFVTRGMIQLALSGASHSGSVRGNRQQPNTRAFLRTSSSELDTDAEGEDFELLDQSELNQLDPASSRGQ